MLLAEKLTPYSGGAQEVERLYLSAFPENERGPLALLLNDPTGSGEVYAFYDATAFCGFAALLTLGDIAHILYIAVDGRLRGKGYGGEILQELRALKPGCKLVADIEAVTPSAANGEERGRRKAFYLKNGFEPTKIAYDWRGESYEILVSGGALTEQEFWAFWEAAEKSNPAFAKF